MTRDALGNEVSGSPEAVGMLDEAVDRSLRHDGGVREAAAAAVEADPTLAAAHAVLALADPAAAEQSLADARSLVERGTDYERSLVGFLDLLLTDGMWAAERAGLAHATAHPRDLLGVGLAATIVERSTRTDVQQAVLAVYEPSRQVLGDHPYLLAMIGFVAQEQGRFAEAGEMARQALEAQPTSVTAAHLRTHVHVETADHEAGLAWLDSYRKQMDPRGDYVHHLSWHAALHTLALGDADGTLARLADMSGPDCDAFRHVVDNGTLLMRCRLYGLLGPDDDPSSGCAGDPPVAWLAEMPSMYVGFHTAVGLAVQRRSDDLRALARRAPSMAMPGAADLLAPLCRALADYVDRRHDVATDALLALRPSTYRWGGSRAQRDVVDDILVDCAIRAGRDDVATALLVERTDRRPNRWDSTALASVRVG